MTLGGSTTKEASRTLTSADTHNAAQVREALARSARWFIDAQDEEGYWVGELEADVTLNAEYLMFLHFMGLSRSAKRPKLLEHIRRRQLDDGSWNIYHEGPGNVSASVEAYFAFKLNGYTGEEPFMVRAREWILANGGVMATRFLTKIYLAYFEQFPWQGIPSLPIHIMLLPRISPVNIYRFSCWARSYTVPLLVLNQLKPNVPVPDGGGVDELYVVPRDRLKSRDYRFAADSKKLLSWTNVFTALDRVMKLEEKVPFSFHRRPGLKKAEQWILDHQDESGDWGGIFPAMMNCLMALKTLGYSIDHPVMVKGLHAFERMQIEEESVIRHQPCFGPIWDTAWANLALNKTGTVLNGEATGHEKALIAKACKRSTDWMLSQQIRREGDWSVYNKAKPGAWCFQFDNDFYPDLDDTAAVLMCLMADPTARTDPKKREAIDLGFDWLLSMQNPDGGFAAFEHRVDQEFWNEIPYNDCKNMLDPSTEDLTGRVLAAMGAMGMDQKNPAAVKAIQFLKTTQKDDGSWFGRWGVNYIYGTWSCLHGLYTLGYDMSEPWIQHAADWLEKVQSEDNGWGEACDSYETECAPVQGCSTASQTAWAVWSLALAGRTERLSTVKGMQYLLDNQQPDGMWEEDHWTGTGFPGAFYLKYHMYPKYFPALALAAVADVLNKDH